MQTIIEFQPYTVISHTVSRNILFLKKLNLVATTLPKCGKSRLLDEKTQTLQIYQSTKQKKKATHPTDENSSSNV